MSPAYKIQEWGGGRYRVTNAHGQQIGPLFSTEKAARTAGKDYAAHLRKLDREIAAGNKAYRKGQSTMAKRKHYGSTKAAHRTQAETSLETARFNARKIRAELQRGNCIGAFDKLGALNRLIGRAQKEIGHARGARAGSRRGGDNLFRVARSLQNKWLMKCMR